MIKDLWIRAGALYFPIVLAAIAGVVFAAARAVE
jgi:hypothetical protein